MKLIILYGPPAVGKMTVGRSLAKKTGYRLFYNHMSIDLVLAFFEFGSEEFKRANNKIRFALFEEMAQSTLTGLIFTYVWAVGHPEDDAFLKQVETLFKSYGVEVKYVQLESDLEQRLSRNKHPERLKYKPTKRDLGQSNKNLLFFEKNYKMYIEGADYPEKDIFKLNNNEVLPTDAAEQIIDYFNLEVVY